MSSLPQSGSPCVKVAQSERIDGSRRAYYSMIQTWIRLYLEKGKDYFNCDASKQKKNTLITRIPPPQILEHINLVTPRKPKHPKVDESLLPDEIRNELNKLRMENEYLKKLNALVRKKGKSQTRIKLK